MDSFELILDTADVEGIKSCMEILDVQGVTTNPSIICKTGKPAEQAIQDVIDILGEDQKLFVQVVATDYETALEDCGFEGVFRKNILGDLTFYYEGNGLLVSYDILDLSLGHSGLNAHADDLIVITIQQA